MRTAARFALALCTASLAATGLRAERRRAHRHDRPRSLAALRQPEPPPDVSARRARALDAFARSGHVRRCWMQQLQRDATTGPRALAVRLEVDAGGRTLRVILADPEAPSLARCLVAGAWSLAPVGAGAPFVAEGTLRFDRGE